MYKSSLSRSFSKVSFYLSLSPSLYLALSISLYLFLFLRVAISTSQPNIISVVEHSLTHSERTAKLNEKATVDIVYGYITVCFCSKCHFIFCLFINSVRAIIFRDLVLDIAMLCATSPFHSVQNIFVYAFRWVSSNDWLNKWLKYEKCVYSVLVSLLFFFFVCVYKCVWWN